MLALFLPLLLALQTLAGEVSNATANPPPALPTKNPIIDPMVLKAEVIANVTDPRCSRDGCVSAKWHNGRVIWTCGDTLAYNNETNKLQLPLVVNTAGWTDSNPDGSPKIVTGPVGGGGANGNNPVLLMYGEPNVKSRKPFYPETQPGACKIINSGGSCPDGSRFIVWQTSGPMVVSDNAQQTVAYAWPNVLHTKAGELLDPIYFSLYKIVSDNTNPDRALLPTATMVNPSFWGPGETGYGASGRVIVGNMAYLYGKLEGRYVGVARVPIGSVENKSKYQYYVNGAWVKKQPDKADPNAILRGLGTIVGGTFYYSAYFGRYVWVGQRLGSISANFWLSTAPKPEGPWSKLRLIYAGQNADSKYSCYGLKAHPALLGYDSRKDNGIYLTWTQAWKVTTVSSGYVTPLVYVSFKTKDIDW